MTNRAISFHEWNFILVIFEKREQEAQAKREEHLKQERESASNSETVKTEEKDDAEAPKSDAPTGETPKTNDVSNSVEKKDDK